MATRRKVDALNLQATIDDLLIEAGIIEDDNSTIIVAHDGSRVLYDKEKPRTEIYITEMEDEGK
jgi:Holliday junction resolvase RusA-like endonuclease